MSNTLRSPHIKPSQRIMRKGAHMLRKKLTIKGGAPSISIVGLGVFAVPDCERRCCVPQCRKFTTFHAAWLYNGDVALLPFCRSHAETYLIADEVHETGWRNGL